MGEKGMLIANSGREKEEIGRGGGRKEKGRRKRLLASGALVHHWRRPFLEFNCCPNQTIS